MDNLDSGQQNTQGQGQSQQYEKIYVKPSLPDDGLILGLGIGSLLMLFICGPAGLIMAIVAIGKAKNAEQVYRQNPGKYDNSTYSLVNSGRICAIIGVVLNSLWVLGSLLYVFIIIGAFGAAALGT